jgi:uncharacterized protein YeaO (DUF488 family)
MIVLICYAYNTEQHTPNTETVEIIPNKSKVEDAREELFEKAFGLNNKVEFNNAIAEKLKNSFSEEKTLEIEKLLNSRGINVRINACPTDFLAYSNDLSDEDWNNIVSSTEQTLTLNAIINYKREIKFDLQSEKQRKEVAAQMETIKALPLIHATTFTGLMKIMESGELISNREVYEKKGASAEQFSTQHITTADDRELGLDQYVFADFGRPHVYRQGTQSEVTIIIGNEVLKTPGAFLTEKDYLDYGDKDSLEKYVSETSVAPYFYEEALIKLKTRGSDVYKFMRGEGDEEGFADFSTWEAKIPRVPNESIRKIIFKDEKQFQSFKEKYGDRIECIYEPNMNSNKERYSDTLGVNEELDRMYAEKISAGYEKRVDTLAKLPGNEKVTVWVQANDVGSIKPRLLNSKTNAFLFGDQVFEHISDLTIPYITEDEFGDAPWSTYAIKVEIPKANFDSHQIDINTPSRFIEAKHFSYSEMKKIKTILNSIQ